MKTGIIYEWRNKLNGKFYVGQTINPESRYKEHLRTKGDSLFHCAIKKYGIDNFEYSVVARYEHETSEGLYDLLNEAEKERIKFRNSLAPNGYNVADGGKNGNTLAGLTEEEYKELCKKHSKANSGENNPMFGKSPKDFMTEEEIEEWGKNTSIALLKYYAENPEARVLLSEKNSGENNGMYGKNPEDFLTPEAIKVRRKKISEGKKQYLIEHPEVLKQQSERMKGDKNPSKRPEIRAKKSERMKGDKNPMKNPEIAKKSAQKIKGQIPVNNGIICKKIPKETLDEFLENNPGWVRGYTKRKEKIPVNNGVICKKIPKETLDEFLANNPDWVYGMIKRKKSA